MLVVPDKNGVRAAGIMESDAPFGQIMDPSHVFSDKNGVLKTPNFRCKRRNGDTILRKLII